MVFYKGKYQIFILLIFLLFSQFLKAQEYRRFSVSPSLGIALLPGGERINDAGLPSNIFGGYGLGYAAGIGLNYRLTDRNSIREQLMIMFADKPDNQLFIQSLSTVFKYNLIPVTKNFSPFFMAGLNVSFLSLSRNSRTWEHTPPDGSNPIGTGIDVEKIVYNDEKLQLMFVPVPGAIAGGGIDLRISPRLLFNLEYAFTYNVSNIGLIRETFFYNQSNLNYHLLTAGITYRFYKNRKQLLAELKKETFGFDNVVSVKGTINYKKDKKSNAKSLPVELTDDKDSTLSVSMTDSKGMFFYKELTFDNYQFMLDKRNNNVVKAKLDIIRDHKKVKLYDEFLSLDMMDDFESENIISRDGNFSVILREGFQHDVDITITALSLSGRIQPLGGATCHNLQLVLIDKKDSIVDVITPGEDCAFLFSDVTPGQYTLAIRRNNADGNLSFNYSFSNPPPFISRQYNNSEPVKEPVTYRIAGKVDAPSAKNIELLLVNSDGKVEQIIKPEQEGKFELTGLPGENYFIAYNIPDKEKGGIMTYQILNNKDEVKKEIKREMVVRTASVGNVKGSGKLAVSNPSKKASDGEIYLINKNNSVAQKVKPAADGSFEFDKLSQDEYKVAYKMPDPKEKAKLTYRFSGAEYEITKITLPVKYATSTKVIKDSISHEDLHKKHPHIHLAHRDNKEHQNINIPERKLITDLKDLQAGNTYSPEGDVISPSGFGIQVIAVFAPLYLKKNYDKLKKAGYNDIYIQVVENAEGKKIYRLVVGSVTDKNIAFKLADDLKKSGFEDVLLRKHL